MTKRKSDPFACRRRPLAERFLEKIAPADDGTDCVLWTGSRSACGYGRIVTGSRYDGSRHIAIASRVAWELANGPIPDGMHVCHRCDRPACVNAEHLFLGTHDDNMRDMRAKGRGFDPTLARAHPNWHGARCQPKRRRFLPEQVAEIRRRLATGETPYRISKDYGVEKNAIRCIQKGWSYHTDPEAP